MLTGGLGEWLLSIRLGGLLSLLWLLLLIGLLYTWRLLLGKLRLLRLLLSMGRIWLTRLLLWWHLRRHILPI